MWRLAHAMDDSKLNIYQRFCDFAKGEFLERFIIAIIRNLAREGRDLPSEAHQVAQGRLSFLRGQHAGPDIDTLLGDGCEEVPLAAVTDSSRFLTVLQDTYYEMTGNPKRLVRVTKGFESTECRQAWPFREIPSSQQVAFYSAFYKLLDDLFLIIIKRMKIHFAPERYAITSYVKYKTGKWYDCEVSSLILAATGRDYNENAHRVWRNRYFGQTKALPFELLWRVAEIFQKEHNRNTKTLADSVTRPGQR